MTTPTQNILCTNDWHFARQNPASRVDDYNGELFGLLHQLLLLVRHFKCSALVIAGDIFHNKGSATWETVIRLLEWGKQVRETAELLTIMGNHDQQHDRYESIGQTPYGALIGSGVFVDISRQLHPVGIYGPKIYGVPWPDGSRPDAFDAIPPEADMVVAHGFATPEGIERWGVYCHKYEDLIRKAPHVKIWHFGHDHSDHGVWKLANGAHVINIGALARGALDTDSIARQVKAAVVQHDNRTATWHCGGVQQIALRQKPAEQIFDMERHAERVREQQHLDAFLDSLQGGLSGVLDVDYEQVLAALPLDDKVRGKVQEYIARAEAAAV